MVPFDAVMISMIYLAVTNFSSLKRPCHSSTTGSEVRELLLRKVSSALPSFTPNCIDFTFTGNCIRYGLRMLCCGRSCCLLHVNPCSKSIKSVHYQDSACPLPPHRPGCDTSTKAVCRQSPHRLWTCHTSGAFRSRTGQAGIVCHHSKADRPATAFYSS